jgi:hypothetical protein
MFGALIKNFAGLISIRFFLGVVQAGFGAYELIHLESGV